MAPSVAGGHECLLSESSLTKTWRLRVALRRSGGLAGTGNGHTTRRHSVVGRCFLLTLGTLACRTIVAARRATAFCVIFPTGFAAHRSTPLNRPGSFLAGT